jgi:hypothetical protein
MMVDPRGDLSAWPTRLAVRFCPPLYGLAQIVPELRGAYKQHLDLDGGIFEGISVSIKYSNGFR